MTGLRASWPAVRRPDRETYGGNQGDFARKGIRVSGCGLIAVLDTLRYLWKARPDCRADFFSRDLPETLSWSRYETLGLALNRRYVHIFPPFGANGIGLAWGMNRFFRRYGMPLQARWGVKKARLWDTIAEMLEKNLPVIFSIGPNWPRLWGKHGVGLYRSPKDVSPVTHVNRHYVTVTGLDERWLRVSSWGQMYYIRRAEFENYVNRYSCNLFSNCLVLKEVPK